jgi:hypothetical protein
MSEQPPITPPPELVEQWANDSVPMKANAIGKDWEIAFASRAAQWGADQELEACCEYLVRCAQWEPEDVTELRAARRLRPPRLKEQALEQLDGIAAVFRMSHGGDIVCDKIRRALEALPDD